MSLETFGDLNYLAVVVAALAHFVLGGLWYSPVLFGSAWQEASGVRAGERSPVPGLVTAFSASVASSLALALLASATGATGLGQAIVLGLVVGLGLSVTALATQQAFESRPKKLHAINLPYHVVGTLIIAVIVTLWR